MESLGRELHNTIRNLERIRDAVHPRSEGVVNTLDGLYDQQIDLIEAAIQRDTAAYKDAQKAMSAAARRTEEARTDLANLEEALDRTASAIDKIGKLLSALV